MIAVKIYAEAVVLLSSLLDLSALLQIFCSRLSALTDLCSEIDPVYFLLQYFDLPFYSY